MDASAGNDMIDIPPGQVTLSDRRTQRSWPVELAPYQLAAVPIAQARYALVTGQRPSTARGDQLPVERVSWWEAGRFCNAPQAPGRFRTVAGRHSDRVRPEILDNPM